MDCGAPQVQPHSDPLSVLGALFGVAVGMAPVSVQRSARSPCTPIPLPHQGLLRAGWVRKPQSFLFL